MRSLEARTLLVLFFYLSAPVASADPVAIVNAGFEEPVMAPGTYTYHVDPPGWTFIGTTRRAVWNVSAGWDTWFPYGAPEGNQIGALWEGSFVQTLGVVLAPNTTYTLQAEYMHVPDRVSEFTLELLAGGVSLGSTGGLLPPFVDGTFYPAEVVVTTGATPAHQGESLVIRISSTATEAEFDNIRLDASSISTTNLIVNGSFETVDNPSPGVYLQISTSPPNPYPVALCDCLTGWEIVGNGVEWVHPSSHPILGNAADGSHYIDLTLWANIGAGVAGIKQDFSTIVGQSYTLTFFAATSTGYGRYGTGQFVVNVAGISQTFDLNNPVVESNWMEYQVDFEAIDTVTTIQFTNNQDDYFYFSLIDNVVVAADSVTDGDGDGVPDADDNCPDTANSDQTDTDGDSEGDACDLDDDGDGVSDDTDNCPLTINPDQEDFDGDGAGDLCDTDADNDEVLDAVDACLFTPAAAIINTNGCAIADLCPCIHPDGTDKWKNHGKYVSCVAHAANDFRDALLISNTEHGDIVSEAGMSACGVKN